MNAMFAQLDTGSSYRRPITRELWPAGGPHRPITTKDLAAFESITPVEAKPVEEWETRKFNKKRPFIPVPEGLDLSRNSVDICRECGVSQQQVAHWRKITGISWSVSHRKSYTGNQNGNRGNIDWSTTTVEEHENTYPEVMAARLKVSCGAVTNYRHRKKIRCLLPPRNSRRAVTPPHSPAPPDAPQASAATPAPSPDVPATPR